MATLKRREGLQERLSLSTLFTSIDDIGQLDAMTRSSGDS